MKNLAQFFQDDSTRCFSATRLAFLAWIFSSLIVWGVGSIHDKKMQEVPGSVTALIGILMTGKVIQKFGETSSSTSAADPQINGNVPSGRPPLIGNGFSAESTAFKP